MKALRFNEYGQPDVLQVTDMEQPTPGPGEVLVRVAAAAINPSDVKNVAGLFSATLPRTPGRDFSGTVVSEGAWQGKAVWGSGAGFGVVRDGAQREYLCLPADWLSEMPANLSLPEAATVGVPYVTAWTALVRAGDIRSGETVLITGSNGAVGRAAIQIAHWKGARVIAVGRSDHPSEADVAINTSKEDLQAVVVEVTGGRGVDMVLDAVGGSMFEPVLKTLGQGGRQVAITSAGMRRVEFDLMDYYHSQLHLIGVDTMKLTGIEIASILDALRPGFESGALTPAPYSLSSIEGARKAYASLSVGKASQKQVIVFD
jgi:NADPH:quinone reductase-like Zn-dependent oxidoreductase